MKILLTGATGFLGNNILRLLAGAGHDVTILTRHTSDPRPTDGLQVEKIFADLREPGEIGLALEGIDAVIHSAALIQVGWSKLESSLAVNVSATRELAQAARRKSIRMVYISTVDTLRTALSIDEPLDEAAAIDGGDAHAPIHNPPCSYVVSKTRAEKAFRDEIKLGLNGLVVQPGFMVGPWDWKPSSGKMILAVAKQFTPFAPAGGCSVVDVRDVADGVYLALKKGLASENYILAGENMSYLDLWKLIARVSGGRAPRRTLPDWLAMFAGKAGDAASRLFSGSERQVNSAATAMGQLNHYYTSDKAREQLGYRTGSVEDALVDAWEWFKNYGYLK